LHGEPTMAQMVTQQLPPWSARSTGHNMPSQFIFRSQHQHAVYDSVAG
jgi:hypothetical protein